MYWRAVYGLTYSSVTQLPQAAGKFQLRCCTNSYLRPCSNDDRWDALLETCCSGLEAVKPAEMLSSSVCTQPYCLIVLVDVCAMYLQPAACDAII